MTSETPSPLLFLTSLHHESCQPAPRRTVLRQWRRRVLLSLGVLFQRCAPRRRRAFALALIFIGRAECNLVLFVAVRAITFRELRQTRAVPIALGQGERGSKFSRRPQRSCSVGAAKLMNYVYDSSCPAVRQRTGLGLGTARRKLWVMVQVSS